MRVLFISIIIMNFDLTLHSIIIVYNSIMYNNIIIVIEKCGGKLCTLELYMWMSGV